MERRFLNKRMEQIVMPIIINGEKKDLHLTHHDFLRKRLGLFLNFVIN